MDDELINEIALLILSGVTSASTRRPDDPGPGGQAMTGWFPAARIHQFLIVAESNPKVNERIKELMNLNQQKG